MPRSLSIGLAAGLAAALLGPVALSTAGPATATTRIAADVPIFDVAFTPDGLYAYAVGFNDNSRGRLWRITLSTNTSEELISTLVRPGSVAVRDDSQVLIGGYGVLYTVNPTSITPTDFTCGANLTVTSKSLTSNVATITTYIAHGYAPGQSVWVEGVDSPFDGSHTITSVPTATTFTYAKTAADVPETPVVVDPSRHPPPASRVDCVTTAQTWVPGGWGDIGAIAVSDQAAYAVNDGKLARIVKSAGAWPAASSWSQIWSGSAGARGMAVTADDSILLVGNEGGEMLRLDNPRTCSPCTPVAVPGTHESGSHGIAIHPSGTFAYYARNNQNSFRRLDLVSNAITSITGDSGSGSRDVAFSADGAYAYLVYTGEHARNPSINQVRTSDNTVIATVTPPVIPCKSDPRAIATSPINSTFLVAAAGATADGVVPCPTLGGAVYRFPTTAAAPTSLSASPINGSATISFAAGSDGFAEISNYQYSTDSGGTWTALSPDDTTSPVTVSGLVNGVATSIQLRAVNASGSGAASSTVVVTARTTPGTPTAVTGAPGDAQANLTWGTPASDGGDAISGYAIEKSTDGTNWSVAVADTGSAATTGTVPSLVNGTGYQFRVAAINDAGTGGFSSASSTVTPRTVPDAPTGVTATAGNAQASVSWTAPTSDGGSAITSYTATASPGGAFCTTGANSCIVTGLSNGTTYTFTVTATNAGGPGSASVASAAVTPTAPATPGPGPGPGPIPDPTPTPTPTADL